MALDLGWLTADLSHVALDLSASTAAGWFCRPRYPSAQSPPPTSDGGAAAADMAYTKDSFFFLRHKICIKISSRSVKSLEKRYSLQRSPFMLSYVRMDSVMCF